MSPKGLLALAFLAPSSEPPFSLSPESLPSSCGGELFLAALGLIVNVRNSVGIIQAFFATPAKIHIPSLTLPFWPIQYLFSLCCRASLRTKIILHICAEPYQLVSYTLSQPCEYAIVTPSTAIDLILSGLHI